MQCCDLISIILQFKANSVDKSYQREWERRVGTFKYTNIFWIKDAYLVKKAEANVTGKAGEIKLWETLKDRWRS